MIEPLFNLNMISSFLRYNPHTDRRISSLSKGKSEKSAFQGFLFNSLISDLCFVGGDVLEAGGVARAIHKIDNSTEGSAAEVRDLAVCVSIEGP